MIRNMVEACVWVTWAVLLLMLPGCALHVHKHIWVWTDGDVVVEMNSETDASGNAAGAELSPELNLPFIP